MFNKGGSIVSESEHIERFVDSSQFYSTKPLTGEILEGAYCFLSLLENFTDEKFVRNFAKSLRFNLRESRLSHYSRIFEDATRCGQGLVVQFAPSNTPVAAIQLTVFAYLFGNTIITRFSERDSRLYLLILKVLSSSNPSLKHFNDRVLFCSYPSSEVKLTQLIQRNAAVRVIWGSDSSVADIRKIPAGAACTDLTFPNRNSILLVNSDYWYQADQKAKVSYLKSVSRDLLEYLHTACASPKYIFLIGNHDCSMGVPDFAFQLRSYLQSMDKYSFDFSISRDLSAAALRLAIGHSAQFLTGTINQFLMRHGKVKQGGVGQGNLIVYCLRSLDDVLRLLPPAVQTCTYIGFQPRMLFEFFSGVGQNSPTRIVPTGQAFAMRDEWDRFRFHEVLTRRIEVI